MTEDFKSFIDLIAKETNASPVIVEAVKNGYVQLLESCIDTNN